MSRIVSLIHRMCAHWGLSVVALVYVAYFVLNLSMPERLPCRVRYEYRDVAQYYMGAVATQEGLVDCLYPESGEYSLYGTGIVQEPLRSILQKRGWTRGSVYIYPPMLAPYFIPMAWFRYPTAAYLFLAVSMFSALWMLRLVEKTFEFFQTPSNVTSFLIVLGGCGFPLFQALAVGNINVILALLIGLTLLGLMRNDASLTAIGYYGAAITKGISAPWVPLLFIYRKKRVIGWGILFTVITLYVSFRIYGLDPHWDFLYRVIPESRYLYAIGGGNLGLPSFFAHITKSDLVSPLLKLTEILLYIALYLLAVWVKTSEKTQILSLFGCVLIFSLFSPICWPHTPILFLPFLPWGWYATRSKGMRILYAGSWVLLWLPIAIGLKTLFGSPMLGFLRTFAMFGLCLFTFIALACSPREFTSRYDSSRSDS